MIFFFFKLLLNKIRIKNKNIININIKKISLIVKLDLNIKTGKKERKIKKLSLKLINFSS